MRFSFLLLLLSSSVASVACAACGGAAVPSEPSPVGSQTPEKEKEKAKEPDPSNPGSTGGQVTGECTNAEPVLVKSGGTIARPTGSALRLELVYQGSSIGVRKIRGVDMILKPSVGPFAPGKNAGYWADVIDGSGAIKYTEYVNDPTRLEAPASPGGSDWKNSTIAQCDAKTILIDVPNNTGDALVIYGSPYGTSNGAVELARFTLK